MRLKIVSVLFLAVQSLLGSNNPVLIIRNTDKNIEVGKYLMVLEDKDNSYSIDEAEKSDKFIPSKTNVPNLGISSSSFWVKLQVTNHTDNEDFLFVLTQPTIDEVQWYVDKGNGEFDVIKFGENVPFSVRKYNDPNYIFDFKIKKNESKILFFKVRSNKNTQLPVLIGTSKTVFEYLKTIDVLSGVYWGVMIVIIIYNLFLFFSIRDRSYLLYVAYVILILLTQTSLQGYTFQFLWPNNTWLETHSLFLFPALVGMAGLEFMKDFLKIKENSKFLYQISFVFIVFYLIAITLGISGYYIISFHMIDINAASVSIFMLYTAIKVYIKGYRPARFFLLSWSIFLVGVCVYVLKDLEILPYNNFTRYTMHVGSALETILLSFALGDRINILKKEKEESRQKTLEVLKENEKIITEQNLTLETKVRERTNELEMLNASLKETQTQLINAEKMASVGQLTAGIAHEINNPINFVISNIKPLQRDVNDILHLLAKYSEIEDEKELQEKLAIINHSKETLDINYLITEINLLLKGIDDGANRTAAIVKGLRTFSRVDEDDLKKADIHEGLDATLTLLNNSIDKSKITIIKDYDPNIQPIECYPGKINQVFMNILHNAIQAMNEKKGGEEKNITIKTYKNDRDLFISIKDNGVGIPEKIKNKIFDPFFTTKQVGEGTGLGLSIAHSIIKSHNGEIQIKSEEGKGTEFIIVLPLSQSHKN